MPGAVTCLGNEKNPGCPLAMPFPNQELSPWEDPLAQFGVWFEEARARQVPMPEAMTLATVDPNGLPDARMVLLKDRKDHRFYFFTNYRGKKSADLTAHPNAALVFWWEPLRRQVRIRGPVDRASDAESDGYFQSRPRNSQLGAWVSPQSEPIDARETLLVSFTDYERRFKGRAVPRPSHWGGFYLAASEIEFWQEQPFRLHDRLLYRRMSDGTWSWERLAP